MTLKTYTFEDIGAGGVISYSDGVHNDAAYTYKTLAQKWTNSYQFSWTNTSTNTTAHNLYKSMVLGYDSYDKPKTTPALWEEEV